MKNPMYYVNSLERKNMLDTIITLRDDKEFLSKLIYAQLNGINTDPVTQRIADRLQNMLPTSDIKNVLTSYYDMLITLVILKQNRHITDMFFTSGFNEPIMLDIYKGGTFKNNFMYYEFALHDIFSEKLFNKTTEVLKHIPDNITLLLKDYLKFMRPDTYIPHINNNTCINDCATTILSNIILTYFDKHFLAHHESCTHFDSITGTNYVVGEFDEGVYHLIERDDRFSSIDMITWLMILIIEGGYDLEFINLTTLSSTFDNSMLKKRVSVEIHNSYPSEDESITIDINDISFMGIDTDLHLEIVRFIASTCYTALLNMSFKDIQFNESILGSFLYRDRSEDNYSTGIIIYNEIKRLTFLLNMFSHGVDM